MCEVCRVSVGIESPPVADSMIILDDQNGVKHTNELPRAALIRTLVNVNPSKKFCRAMNSIVFTFRTHPLRCASQLRAMEALQDADSQSESTASGSKALWDEVPRETKRRL